MDPISSSNPLPSPAVTTPKSYLDFDGLGQLKGQARQDAKAASRETAQQFEALFIQMMMKSMREATPKSDLNESSGKDTFEGMFDKEVSVQMAKRNTLGVADLLVKSMPIPDAAAPSTAAMLEARSAGISLNRAQAGLSLQAQKQALTPLQRPGPIPLISPKGLLDRGTL